MAKGEDLLQKFQEYLDNTPKEQIQKDIQHAKRYDPPNGGGILIDDLMSKEDWDQYCRENQKE